MKPPEIIRLTPGKRVLFLTKDPDLIRRQLRGELDLRMEDLDVEDLLDDINTDAMTPAWVCFSHRPEDLARDAYAGLIVDGKRLFERDALIDGNFEVIVSGYRKGVGSSRETAVQAEKWSGIRIAVAASFAPIHARNNINQGVLMGDHDDAARACRRARASRWRSSATATTRSPRLVIRQGGLFPFSKALAAGEVELPQPDTGPRPMTMAEKILARHMLGDGPHYVEARRRGGGDGRRRLHPRVHHRPGPLLPGAGVRRRTTRSRTPSKLRGLRGPPHLRRRGAARCGPSSTRSRPCASCSASSSATPACATSRPRTGISPGICHEVAREQIIDPGDFIQATDSHTCMGGVNNALTWGVGATEYADLVHQGFTQVEVPESIRFELAGKLQPGVTAKDLMLYILLNHARPQLTLNRVMEFTGPGVATLSMDERATLTNMATECAARTAIVIADDETFRWLAEWRPGIDVEALRARAVAPDQDAEYAGGVHAIDLSTLRPMVAHPGDPDHGIPSDPTNGAWIDEIGDVPIDIAYGGSCTAGKIDDLIFYHQVVKEAVDAGLKVAPGVRFMIQCGSQAVEEFVRGQRPRRHLRAGRRARSSTPAAAPASAAARASRRPRTRSRSRAINRNYKGRSGPGKLWLASPLTVAASAFTGRITAYSPGMFARMAAERPVMV